jgi:hypothetical protein
MALKLTSLVLNMFCTSIFLGHYKNLCFMLKQIIQGKRAGIFPNLTGWFFVSAIGSVDLTKQLARLVPLFSCYDRFPLND